MIETNAERERDRERESKKPVLDARLDYIMIYIDNYLIFLILVSVISYILFEILSETDTTF